MSTPRPFLVLAFDHPLQAVDSVAERIAAGLACHGLNAVASSLPRDAARLAELQPDQLEGVLSLGPMPLSVRVNQRPLWEHFSCRFTVFLLDALLYDLARVPVMREFLAAAQHDRRLGLASPKRTAIGSGWARCWRSGGNTFRSLPSTMSRRVPRRCSRSRACA